MFLEKALSPAVKAGESRNVLHQSRRNCLTFKNPELLISDNSFKTLNPSTRQSRTGVRFLLRTLQAVQAYDSGNSALRKGRRWLKLLNLSHNLRHYLKILHCGQTYVVLNMNSFVPAPIQLLRPNKIWGEGSSLSSLEVTFSLSPRESQNAIKWVRACNGRPLVFMCF